ncbi:MAG: hypothetical protein JW779_13100 [Candidatus Thorarchaeota archaeon]|nr:hypothetical protein [Candidatus Thorarchaeota archaeon]
MSNIVPFFTVMLFIVLVIVLADRFDKDRNGKIGDAHSRILERREKQHPYMMAMGIHPRLEYEYARYTDYSEEPSDIEKATENHKEA